MAMKSYMMRKNDFSDIFDFVMKRETILCVLKNAHSLHLLILRIGLLSISFNSSTAVVKC